MKERILVKIAEIAKCLTERDNRMDDGLYGICGGKILFFAHYYELTKDEKWKSFYIGLIDKCLNLLESEVCHYSYANGICGYLCLFQYLNKHKFTNLDFKEVQKAYDKFLYNNMMEQIARGEYDYLHRSLGIAYYFLLANRVDYIIDYINLLYNVSKKENTSIFWIDKLDPLDINQPNISLSHGMTSIVVFLSLLYSMNIEKKKSYSMLYRTINYIFSQKNVGEFCGSLYPSKCKNDRMPYSRLGWCYGDLSIGVGLWQAGSKTGNKEWMEESVKLFNCSCGRRSLKENFVFDAGFCHGASGIYYLFKRMYECTGNSQYFETGKYWLYETLNMAKYPDGNAGYKSLNFTMDSLEPMNLSLIDGISGIGLVLLSAINNKFDWERFFLLHF